ncbi:LacI family DNA-binding transcriptional regulator [Nocardioides bruguierae]|uniref:LacI family DNA-binding transcriptional regulator n=1 Tax=Nocardioides bruguierae TaxID=2945102 RepID=UPI002020C5B1|nr:LacI family DNA-binding transcriptional regulator [Nocardioides bruguierae]MCL8025468.1 LacI family transcriptional regulator [Nocardioides bruguierae]
MPSTPGRSVSVKDVAAAAGVSLGTVSNVLNRPDRVSEATRARVQRAMADLGFVRNESARQLRSGVSRTLAYVMLDAGNPFFTDVAAGIETAAEAHGLTVVLGNSGSRREREQAHLDQFEQQRVQGLLVTPVDPDSPLLDQIARRGTPVVIVDRTREGDDFCSVAVDDVLGGRVAMEHLLDRGHRRVAFIGGPADLGQVRDRLAGARTAWAEAGLNPEDLVLLSTADLTVADGREAGQRLAGMSSSRRPTAAFCVNDLIALGLLQQVIASGLRCPADLAILGYDDVEYAAAAAVPLSSVRQPRQQLGRTAAELVLEEAAGGEHTHQRVLFTPELVARASTLG